MHHIAVAGAGIGGLSCAIALERAGSVVTVFEQAPELRAAGAGLILQTNAMMVVDELGLGDAIRDIGAELGRSCVMTSDGAILQELDLRTVMADAPSGVAIHREELLPVLRGAFSGEVVFDAQVVDFEQSDDGVIVKVGGRTHDASALIACDGLHSKVRGLMRGSDPLRYAGYTTWRGIASGVEIEPRITEIWGGAHRFGIVPLRGGRAYWFAVSKAPSGGADDDPGAELRDRFKGWPKPVAALLDATPNSAILRTDVFDRPPIDTWVDGRVALLGDAAHPMTPNLGQGAGQAIEDALAIGGALRDADHIVGGLQAYERARRKRANWFVQQSWRFGQMAQLENALLRAARDLSLKLTPDSITRRSLRTMYTPVTTPA